MRGLLDVVPDDFTALPKVTSREEGMQVRRASAVPVSPYVQKAGGRVRGRGRGGVRPLAIPGLLAPRRSLFWRCC